jgi:hypothetical protein
MEIYKTFAKLHIQRTKINPHQLINKNTSSELRTIERLENGEQHYNASSHNKSIKSRSNYLNPDIPIVDSNNNYDFPHFSGVGCTFSDTYFSGARLALKRSDTPVEDNSGLWLDLYGHATKKEGDDLEQYMNVSYKEGKDLGLVYNVFENVPEGFIHRSLLDNTLRTDTTIPWDSVNQTSYMKWYRNIDQVKYPDIKTTGALSELDNATHNAIVEAHTFSKICNPTGGNLTSEDATKRYILLRINPTIAPEYVDTPFLSGFVGANDNNNRHAMVENPQPQYDIRPRIVFGEFTIYKTLSKNFNLDKYHDYEVNDGRNDTADFPVEIAYILGPFSEIQASIYSTAFTAITAVTGDNPYSSTLNIDNNEIYMIYIFKITDNTTNSTYECINFMTVPNTNIDTEQVFLATTFETGTSFYDLDEPGGTVPTNKTVMAGKHYFSISCGRRIVGANIPISTSPTIIPTSSVSYSNYPLVHTSSYMANGYTSVFFCTPKPLNVSNTLYRKIKYSLISSMYTNPPQRVRNAKVPTYVYITQVDIFRIYSNPFVYQEILNSNFLWWALSSYVHSFIEL